jgi:hypothetical protein
VRASAYLSIFDDWELLAPALASIHDRVEEIVVVDGAYRWMAPFFTRSGRDPRQSLPEVQAALAPFAPKLRVINGLWANELEKRIAGYAACRERYVYRIDADEVLFFDDAEVNRFLASPQGVAEMAMPIYLAPGLIRGVEGGRIECQSFLFDRDRIGPAEHCAYLWLVLTAAERAALPAHRHLMVHQTPVAFNAHLTQWRPPRTALARARFYTLNHLREHRDAAWLPGPPFEEGLDDPSWLRAFFQRIAPERYTELLLGQAVTVGWTGLGQSGVRASPLTPGEEQRFVGLRDAQLEALAALNSGLASNRREMRTATEYLIDLSTTAARTALGAQRVVLAFDEPVSSIEARRIWMTATPPHQFTEAVASRILVDRVVLDLPETAPEGSLRCVLGIAVRTRSGGPLVSFWTEISP